MTLSSPPVLSVISALRFVLIFILLQVSLLRQLPLKLLVFQFTLSQINDRHAVDLLATAFVE